jgi:alkaline phosphatase D
VAANIRRGNPHFKHVELTQRGYMLLDVDPSRVVCEWWYVDTVAQPSRAETLGAAFQVVDGSNRLTPASGQTPAKPNPPALAPAPAIATATVTAAAVAARATPA